MWGCIISGALDKGQVLRRLFDYLGITEKLPLKRMGVDGPVDRYYFTNAAADPRQFDMPFGLDAYEAHLREAFQKEQGAIDGFMTLLRQSAGGLDRLEFLFRKQPVADLIDQTEPLWEVLDRLGCSPGLKAVLSVPSVWIGVPPPLCPQFYHTITLASFLFSSWRLESNGAHLVNVLVQRFTDLGGRVLCGQAVRRINVRGGHSTGLTLENGEQHDAPLVVGTVQPRVLLNLLGPETVKPSYRRKIMGFTNTHGVFSVNATVPADVHEPLPYNMFSMTADTNGAVNDVIYAQLRPSGQPESLLLTLITGGHDELWRHWEQTRSGYRGDGYGAAKMELAHSLIDKVAPVTGELKGLEVIDTYTPLTIRDWVNSPDGSAYGVMRSHMQMLSAALLNRTAVKGLYLAGQSVMAPGVLGTILGSLVTTKFIVGAERFGKEVQL